MAPFGQALRGGPEDSLLDFFLAGEALVSQVAGAPTCRPGDFSAPTTSARVLLVVLTKSPLRALPPTLLFRTQA